MSLVTHHPHDRRVAVYDVANDGKWQVNAELSAHVMGFAGNVRSWHRVFGSVKHIIMVDRTSVTWRDEYDHCRVIPNDMRVVDATDDGNLIYIRDTNLEPVSQPLVWVEDPKKIGRYDGRDIVPIVKTSADNYTNHIYPTRLNEDTIHVVFGPIRHTTQHLSDVIHVHVHTIDNFYSNIYASAGNRNCLWIMFNDEIIMRDIRENAHRRVSDHSIFRTEPHNHSYARLPSIMCGDLIHTVNGAHVVTFDTRNCMSYWSEDVVEYNNYVLVSIVRP